MTALGRCILFVLVVGVFASCTSPSSAPAQTPSSIAFDLPETTLIAPPEGIDLTEADAILVDFQAAWVCEFQRRTFVDAADGDEALGAALAEAEIDPALYEHFVERLAQSQDLRDVVLYRYQETCRG